MSNVIDFDAIPRSSRRCAAARRPGERRGRLLEFKRPLRPEELLLQRMRMKPVAESPPAINPETLHGFGW